MIKAVRDDKVRLVESFETLTSALGESFCSRSMERIRGLGIDLPSFHSETSPNSKVVFRGNLWPVLIPPSNMANFCPVGTKVLPFFSAINNPAESYNLKV